ncbi:DUF402 domain-containing protein [Natronomonas sp. EA1]|uniref:DUF402 domain-containing protein n=1 Tax=Natronomonas sp. EA1 TaxID=3421655 RepID=UPI003EBABD1C
MSESPRVRVRGIYTTAITHLFDEVVQASPPIERRFDRAFPLAPADVEVDTTFDRQGVRLTGAPEAVQEATDRLQSLSVDTLAWASPAPRGAVFQGVVTDTLGSGAVVDLGETEGFLPYRNAEDRVEEGDVRRVQVTASEPPWCSDRPELHTGLEVPGSMLTLSYGGRPRGPDELLRMQELVPQSPPEGWATRWDPHVGDASMETIGEAIEAASERAETLMQGVAGADPDDAPGPLVELEATTHVWFGREGRFALDDLRREVATTMPGHHRIKAGTNAASAAVDFAEAVCDPAGEFPFDTVARQFGPREGDRVSLGHGKPDGRLITLGKGEVTTRDADGITIEREMSPGGTYDALGVPRESGDIATTKLKEGRWWYATVYRGENGERRGTYVNVCTPVEIFPETARYVDLHVDVVKHADGTVERVDDDELDAAVEAGNVPEALAERARRVASKIENAL